MRQHALIGQVGPPQRDNIPGGPAWRIRVIEADFGERPLPLLRHANASSGRPVGIKPQCLPCRWREPQPVGERREDRVLLRFVLAPLVVTQPVLVQAGKAGHLYLREAVLLKDRDDVAEITLRACVQNVVTCADPLDYPAHLRDSQNHGALPVPLVARQPVRCYLSAFRYVK